jgi:hypothetical protein
LVALGADAPLGPRAALHLLVKPLTGGFRARSIVFDLRLRNTLPPGRARTEGEEVTEFLNKINPYLTILTLFIAAVFNATVVYFEYHKTPLWKVIGSVLTTILLVVFGVVRLRALL